MSFDAALLWDESFYWGLMMHDALRRAGVRFSVLSSEDVRQGALEGCKALFVPGGWAGNKQKALGRQGARMIRRFVQGGGAYVGVCGGAGLCTTDGLGLLGVRRKPLKDRVPSLSGRVRLRIEPGVLWDGIEDNQFHIWWPSQLVIDDAAIEVRARLESATDEAFSSDLCVGDMSARGWGRAQEFYGINLDPAKMVGDPLVVEGACGEGRVIASLVHFDTPGCRNGEIMLGNLCRRLGLSLSDDPPRQDGPPSGGAFEITRGLMEFGLRNFLWAGNGPVIVWRRGIRGFEYFNLHQMVARLSSNHAADGHPLQNSHHDIKGLEDELAEFVALSKELLLMEREALQRGEPISFAHTRDPEITSARERLFARSKSYGGWYKQLLDRLDLLLFARLSGRS